MLSLLQHMAHPQKQLCHAARPVNHIWMDSLWYRRRFDSRPSSFLAMVQDDYARRSSRLYIRSLYADLPQILSYSAGCAYGMPSACEPGQ